MTSRQTPLTHAQLAFKEMFVGTLIYAVVLGFFNDYTSVFSAQSSSTILLAALIMQTLTYLTFGLKNIIVHWLKDREGAMYRVTMFFAVWLVMFLSKFVFLYAIDVAFGGYVTISNFFGLIAIIVTVTLLSKLADSIFQQLGKQP